LGKVGLRLRLRGTFAEGFSGALMRGFQKESRGATEETDVGVKNKNKKRKPLLGKYSLNYIGKEEVVV